VFAAGLAQPVPPSTLLLLTLLSVPAPPQRSQQHSSTMAPRAVLAALLLLTTPSSACAGSLSLHRVFSDSMVLQAEAPRVYGKGTPGSTVTVRVGSEVYPQTVDKSGDWVAKLPPRAASPPAGPGVSILVEAANGEQKQLHDVLFGDLWVCGGQSNMEFSVAEAFDSEQIIATADIPGLRLYAVQKNKSAVPLVS